MPDGQFKGDGEPVVEGVMSATQPLLPQLVSTGYGVGRHRLLRDVALPLGPTATRNLFAKATWIVQKAERDFMFSDKPTGIVQPATYDALRNAKTKMLDDEDFDVFGEAPS